MTALYLWAILINLFTFALFGADKHFAKTGARRVPEHRLFLFALLGGSAGAIFGMYVFRHKTRKPRFRLGLPLVLLLHAFVLIWLVR